MQNHNGFRRIICVTILCALLMVSMGRATRVSAVGTTAAIAGTAFILTGAVYLSYVALTQGEMVLPAAQELHNYLGSIGKKVAQYPSGAAAYQDIYQGLLRDPAANVIDGVWTWTQDRLRSFANDFSDTRIIQDIAGYIHVNDTTLMSWNGFTYPFEMKLVPEYVYINGFGANYTFEEAERQGYSIAYPSGELVYLHDSTNKRFCFTTETRPLRNKLQNGVYSGQVFDGSQWVAVGRLNVGVLVNNSLIGVGGTNEFYTYAVQTNRSFSGTFAVPLFPHCDIYDADNDQIITAAEPAVTDFRAPQWVDPDNENRPIIPWVPIPQLPVNVTPPSGFVNPQWGFNLQDLLDKLEHLAGQLIDIGGIASLINEFAGLHGDEYYIEYNDGDTNYYTYYQPTVYDNDTQYVTYNINVSEQEDVIPVDMNTIKLYTNNHYLDEVKSAARGFGSVIGEYVAFWHNCDPVVTYTILGSFVLILLGAFIGKWGHS